MKFLWVSAGVMSLSGMLLSSASFLSACLLENSTKDAGAASAGDSGHASPDGSTSMDGYAPLPTQPGAAGFTAIYAPSQGSIYRPLFSEPSCDVVPPYGQYYVVFFDPRDAGPTGTVAECLGGPSKSPCGHVNLGSVGSSLQTESVDGGMYTLSDFDDGGIATGEVDTAQGIVPLIVKNCP